jgi:hypothetical protein
MNRIVLLLAVLSLLSCQRSDHMTGFNAEAKPSANQILLSFKLDFAVPSNLEKNLKMFSVAEIKLKLKIFDHDNNLLFFEDISRTIKYDRWNGVYSIKDSYSATNRSFNDYKSVEGQIYEFSNIALTLKKPEFLDMELILNYDFAFRSVDFLQPFKFIEYYVKSDNMQVKNNKKLFYVKNR